MCNLFKGYIEVKNKKACEPFKNRTEFKTFEEVERLNGYAGVLASDTVLYDFDDEINATAMLKIIDSEGLNCRVYKTTRGIHVLFKNNGKVNKCATGVQLAVGLTADIKTGATNCYEVLKNDGIERELIRECDDCDVAPSYMIPIKSKMDLIGLGEGDGRNSKLFSYILMLQPFLSNEEIKRTLRIINDNLFVPSLSETELNTIMREESFPACEDLFFNEKGAFLFNKFADYLRTNKHIIKINNRLHIYDDGIYVEGSEVIEAEMIRHIPMLNRTKRKEVYDYLNLLVRTNERVDKHDNLIAFRNGVYDITTGELKPFSPDYIITNKIDWDYNPNAYAPATDNTLNLMACHDRSIRLLIEEMIGYCFYRRNELGKAFVLIGDKSNGKSTFLDMVKTLLGEQNISSLDLKELGDRFKTAELLGKIANIGDDIGDEFIGNTAVFKKLVTGDRVSVERKGENPFEFNNYSKFLFSANNIPRMKDRTGAVLRRLVIVPFHQNFGPDLEGFDPDVKYKLRTDESMSYLINIGLEGLKRVRMTNKFTTSDAVERELKEYENSINPINLFFEELDPAIDIENEPTGKVYVKYTDFCLINNLSPMSNIEFSKTVVKHYDVKVSTKRVDGKVTRVFTKA